MIKPRSVGEYGLSYLLNISYSSLVEAIGTSLESKGTLKEH